MQDPYCVTCGDGADICPPPTPAGDISVAYLGQDVSADRSQTRVAIQTEKKVAQKTHVQDRARATARPSAPQASRRQKQARTAGL